ncbi:cAMP-regulated phosphoprotein 19-related protein [Perilla frutescens var. frutescens]|nr:cAMP-regulated phosphoprotein 19-related protein [Perilla frutescens var. frutescens]
MSSTEEVKEQAKVVMEDADKSPPTAAQEEAVVKKKYGGMMPRKPPLISKDHERAYFDSADWALGKQGVAKPKGPLEALRPKLQPTQQQTRYRKSPYAPSEGEDDGHTPPSEDAGQSMVGVRLQYGQSKYGQCVGRGTITLSFLKEVGEAKLRSEYGQCMVDNLRLNLDMNDDGTIVYMVVNDRYVGRGTIALSFLKEVCEVKVRSEYGLNTIRQRPIKSISLTPSSSPSVDLSLWVTLSLFCTPIGDLECLETLAMMTSVRYLYGLGGDRDLVDTTSSEMGGGSESSTNYSDSEFAWIAICSEGHWLRLNLFNTVDKNQFLIAVSVVLDFLVWVELGLLGFLGFELRVWGGGGEVCSYGRVKSFHNQVKRVIILDTLLQGDRLRLISSVCVSCCAERVIILDTLLRGHWLRLNLFNTVDKNQFLIAGSVVLDFLVWVELGLLGFLEFELSSPGLLSALKSDNFGYPFARALVEVLRLITGFASLFCFVLFCFVGCDDMGENAAALHTALNFVQALGKGFEVNYDTSLLYLFEDLVLPNVSRHIKNDKDEGGCDGFGVIMRYGDV